MRADQERTDYPADPTPSIESISAVTLATDDMARAVRFYGTLEFRMLYGGEGASFTSFAVGSGYLNIIAKSRSSRGWWGRIIFYVSDVDALYQRAIGNGLKPDTTPRDAEWGERYFHMTDPDGHELSFAKPLKG